MNKCGFCGKETEEELKLIQTKGEPKGGKSKAKACPQCRRMATSVCWEDAPQEDEEK